MPISHRSLFMRFHVWRRRASVKLIGRSCYVERGQDLFCIYVYICRYIYIYIYIYRYIFFIHVDGIFLRLRAHRLGSRPLARCR